MTKHLEEDPRYLSDIVQKDDPRSPYPSELQFSDSDGMLTPVDQTFIIIYFTYILFPVRGGYHLIHNDFSGKETFPEKPFVMIKIIPTEVGDDFIL